MEEIKVTYNIFKIIQEIDECLNRENYFAALTMSLILPDVCAEVANERKSTRTDYARWCDVWMHGLLPNIMIPINGEEGWGQIIYKLRCGIMHNGEVDVSPQDFKLTKMNVVLFSLENFELFIDSNNTVANIESARTSGEFGYSCNHRISLDIRYLIHSIQTAAIRFINAKGLDTSNFPKLEIYKK